MTLRRIIEYGLYLLVFLLPIQTRWIIKAGEINGEYGTYSLYGTDIVLLLVLFLFLFSKFKQQSSKLKAQSSKFEFKIQNYIWFFIGLIDLAAFISIFFALDKMLAIYAYGRLLLGVGLFWLISSAIYDRTKLLISFLAGVFLQAVLGIWQFIFQASFASKWLGIALHNASDLGTSVIEILNGERWLRAYGGMDHPNMLGGLLVVVLLMLIFLIINQKSEIRNPKQIQNFKFKIQNYFIIYFLLLTLILALFFTFSRAAWLGLVIGILTMAVIIWAEKDLLAQKKLAKIILYSAFFIFILFNIFKPLISARVEGEGRLEEKSKSERLVYFNEAKNIIKKNWITGVGIGNYTLAEHQIDIGRESHYYQPVHNTFLLIWGEAGILGLLGFLGVLGALGWKIVKRKDFWVLPILFFLIVMMFFDHWWWSLHFGVIFLWFILGWLNKEMNSII